MVAASGLALRGVGTGAHLGAGWLPGGRTQHGQPDATTVAASALWRARWLFHRFDERLDAWFDDWLEQFLIAPAIGEHRQPGSERLAATELGAE